MLKDEKFGFIGAGNMGQALIKGLLKKGVVASRNIIVSDSDQDKLALIREQLEVIIARDNQEVADRAEVVILAVKPKDVEGALKGIESPRLIISLVAGITTGYIEERLGKDIPVVRAMPNTPTLIGEGMTAISPGRFAGEEEEKVAEEIFQGVGETVKVREELMEAVTALSGSGPAYIFMIMESLVKAGAKEGLSPELAQKLISRTVLGSASMAIKTGEKLSVLREMVTSPGGTTEAALEVFKEKGLEGILAQGVRTAAKRAKELKREGGETGRGKRWLI